MSDAAFAAALADQAGRMLLDLRASSGLRGKALGDAGDARANAFICRAIRDAWPADGLLSEETVCDGARLSHDRVWIVDPVDGTREYGEGRDDWAVHVGLAIGGAAASGAVALPALGLVLRSDEPLALPVPPARPRIVVSRSRPPPEAVTLGSAIGADVVPMGSAGAKAMAVVRGEAEIYLHAGGQHEWDNCAPAAVAAAHGLHVSRLNGSPLSYNRATPYVPDLLICRREWARAVLTALNSSR